MKNYTFNFEESKDFITSFKYDQEQNFIIINYASGQSIPALCNRENLIKILEKMKFQVINSEQFERKQKRKFNLALTMSALAVFMLFVTYFSPSLLLLFTSLATLYVTTHNLAKSQKLIKDIKKNKLFLENATEINSAIKNLTTDEINNIIETYSLRDACIKDDQVLFMNTPNVPIINLNTIDSLSLEETQEIIKKHVITPKNKK